MTLDLAMFEFDKSGCGPSDRKRISTSLALVMSGIECPVRRVVAGADVPGEADSVRRIPLEHRAPVALRAFDVALVPAAADARLDEDCFEGRLADVMGRGPPCFHLLNEDGEGALDGRLYMNALKTLLDRVLLPVLCHVDLLLVSFSAAA